MKKKPEVGDIFTIVLAEQTLVIKIEGIIPNQIPLFGSDFLDEVRKRIA